MARNQITTTDPNDGTYIGLIGDAFSATSPTMFRAAVAYATQSGVAELAEYLAEFREWESVRKKWLVGIDYCRSDPQALSYLDGLPKSAVRIFDGRFVVTRRGCVPKSSYHPKLYSLEGERHSAVVAGSGNLSATGLRKGVEAGISTTISGGAASGRVVTWFNRQWRAATPLNEIADEYERRYEDSDNLKNPVPSDDDAAPESAGRHGQLTPSELRRLSVCKHLWIEAGNLHKNLGKGRPGNQLMMKRNTRVFFGFPATDLDRDTPIGHVGIEYGGHYRADYSLRFSNNWMDVLSLPLPGSDGPPAYDQEVLCFERVGVRRFRLVIGDKKAVTRWKRKSQAVDGAFRMRNSGRQWGVF